MTVLLVILVIAAFLTVDYALEGRRKASVAAPRIASRGDPRGAPRVPPFRLVPALLRYRIGGASLAVISPDAPLLAEGFREYLPFVSLGNEAGAADLAVEVRLGVPALPAAARPLMEAGEAWAAHELGGEILIAPRIDPRSAQPEWLAAVHADRRRTTLTCGETLFVGEGALRRLAPSIHYPLDQVLLSLGLAGEALIVHAAGVQIGGRGVLLAGPSGAGKTTSASSAPRPARDGDRVK